MALQISLVWMNDTTDLDELSLVDFTDGFMPALNGWVQQVAKDDQRSVIEALTLQARASSHDDLAEKIQALDLWKKRVKWSREQVETRLVWLRVAIEDETEARQAQVLDLNYVLNTSLLDQQLVQSSLLRTMQLAIERTPFWEMVPPYPTTAALTGVSFIGGAVQIAQTIVGDVPARIASMIFTPAQDTTEIYLGWRTTRHGVLGQFQPIWQVDDALDLYAGESWADATAYSGNLWRCIMLGALTPHAVLIAGEASSYPNDQRGTYTVLLRAKMKNGASSGWVRMGYGWVNTKTSSILDTPTYRDRVEVASNAWKLYPLGVVTFPPDRNNADLTNAGIQIEAQAISGDPWLDLDCLIFIPIDEGALTTRFVGHINGYTVSLSTFATGEMTGSVIDIVTYIISSASLEDSRWYMPADNEAPGLIVAGQGATSILADTVDITYTYIPRWRTLRGAAQP